MLFKTVLSSIVKIFNQSINALLFIEESTIIESRKKSRNKHTVINGKPQRNGL